MSASKVWGAIGLYEKLQLGDICRRDGYPEDLWIVLEHEPHGPARWLTYRDGKWRVHRESVNGVNDDRGYFTVSRHNRRRE
jgi:hypothetical protein